MITTVRVKKKNIEFQLGGGGYGVFGDDSGTVYVPDEASRGAKGPRSGSRTSAIPSGAGACSASSTTCAATASARTAGARPSRATSPRASRARSPRSAWTPAPLQSVVRRVPAGVAGADASEMRLMLSQFVDFNEGPGGRRTGGANISCRRRPARGDLSRVTELRRGMSMNDVHDMLGDPNRNRAASRAS
jgi:hypothetical protein